jgi:predicted enzyme related to lactoylglutathione lyase
MTRGAPKTGSFCWVGLATSDPKAAQAFYRRLFGWQAEELPAPETGTFTMLRLAGKSVAILYRQTREARAAAVTPHWTSFVLVDHADATAGRAVALGGAAVRESFDVTDIGRVATLRDPAGAIVSLWEPRSMIGAEVRDDAGSLCWNELVTSDAGLAMSFYGDLFGWQYQDGNGYVTIENSGTTVGGIRTQAEDERGHAPEWIPYFCVESVDQAAVRAERAGGHIRDPRREDMPQRRVALMVDPLGAKLGVRGQDPSRDDSGSSRVERRPAAS